MAIHTIYPNSDAVNRQSIYGIKTLSLYSELAKVRLTFLVLVTTFVGFLLASPNSLDIPLFIWTLMGTAFAAGGANGFNQWLEWRRDAKMERTQKRPVPSGRCSQSHAFLWSLVTSCLGVFILWGMVNTLTAILALTVVLLYVLVYTPLKPLTPLCTLVGAVCGAIPPMMGWTAVTGQLNFEAWLLFSLLFVWQIPHFLALAWMYRDDYERGGFQMLPLVDRNGHLTCRIIVVYCLALLPIGVAFSLAGITGINYALVSLVLGGYFLYLGIRFFMQRHTGQARKLFIASILYLPILMGFMVADRNPTMAMQVVEKTNKPEQSQRLMIAKIPKEKTMHL